jgi:glycosyltransferase involved in cell wall biosynthesis
MSNIEKLESSLSRISNKENVIYFLTYDTKNNARAAVKNIYDMALALKESGRLVKILVEDKTYTGVDGWLGDEYNSLEVVSIKEDKVEIKVEDVIVVPEYYSNVLPQLSNIKSVKVMLVQQKDYIFETLPIGSRWSDYGFDKCITTSESSKKYILDYFPESLVHLIPPFIGDNFQPTDKPIKPYVAISCRDRLIHRKLISEFYIKYPQLRWITFRDMVQMSYDEFADNLKECMVSLWVDDESTFGTFPLESMKCGVPVVGKIPNTEPDWLTENGLWTYDVNKLVEILGTFILAWLEGVELTSEVKEKMRETVVPYTKETHNNNTLSIFNSLISIREDSIKKAIEKVKAENNEE